MAKKSKGKEKETHPTTRHGDSVMQDSDPSDLIILLMGRVGSGKSTFINKYFGEKKVAEEGVSINACTRHVKFYTAILRRPGVYQGRRTVFVDTPGFDDSEGGYGGSSDQDILRRMGDWLKASYPKGMSLAGIVYLHDINDKRVTSNTRKLNISLAKRFVGLQDEGEGPVFALVTTCWDAVKMEIGAQREKELKETFWKEAIASGVLAQRSGIGTFQSSPQANGAAVFESPASIVESVLERYSQIGSRRTVGKKIKLPFWKRLIALIFG